MVIFFDDFDRYVFFNKLRKLQLEFGFKVLAYCLMSNHFHLELQDNGITLPIVMNCLQDHYAIYFNSKYKHKGHVFEGPYKSNVVFGFKHIFTLLRYILRNPVSAYITMNVYDYKWSSAKKGNDIHQLVDFNYIDRMYKEYSESIFEEFLEINEDDKKISKIETHKFSFNEAIATINNLVRLYGNVDDIKIVDVTIQKKVIKQANYMGISRRQIQKITGLGIRTIQTICQKTDLKYI